MSVVVAVKENGVIYMGADSQTTAGRYKYTFLNAPGWKIRRLDNGMFVSFCGSVSAEQNILSEKDVFTLDENGELTKKHIVQKIVPKLVRKMDQIGDKENGEIKVSMILAYKDKLYRITPDLEVVAENDYAAMGAGKYFVHYALSMKDLPVRERILKALMESAKRTESVGGPYVLIDTKNNEYEVVDMGGKNY